MSTLNRNTLKKTAAGTALGGALLVAGGLSLAHAAPNVPQAQTLGDGKVNVTVTAATGEQIGTLADVSVANAFTLVNAMCPISGITEANLNDLDVSGTAITQTCGAMGGLSFTFSQNGQGTEGAPGQNGNRGASQNAPGQTKTSVEGQPPSATPPSTPVGQQPR